MVDRSRVRSGAGQARQDRGPDRAGPVHRPGATPARALGVDLGLYLASALFAAYTAVWSTLQPHRFWGSWALPWYALATLAVLAQLGLRRRWPASAGAPARGWLVMITWVGTALVPLVAQAVQRAGGRTDRAQEEVLVVEQAGSRLLHTGTPYLARPAIAALSTDERLLGYTPYQPGMALFGLPRALAGAGWATDARVPFALVTVAVLVLAVRLLRRRPAAALIRAVQAVTVLPICALTLATGGDDLPVLALCLLALALVARADRSARRWVPVGITIGAAAGMKAFALPVLAVVLAVALTRGRRALLGYALPALGLPVFALLAPLLTDPDAVLENVVRFPLGRGLVSSPAASPLPGHLLATSVPGGRAVAVALLALTGLAIVITLVRRPPTSAAAAALVCGYGLTAAMLLMPASRFGYLLYPVAFAVWVPALRREPDTEPIGSQAHTGGRTQGA